MDRKHLQMLPVESSKGEAGKHMVNMWTSGGVVLLCWMFFFCQLAVIQTADPAGIVGPCVGMQALLALKQQAKLTLQPFVLPTAISHHLALMGQTQYHNERRESFLMNISLALSFVTLWKLMQLREKEREPLLLCCTAFCRGLIITYTLQFYN